MPGTSKAKNPKGQVIEFFEEILSKKLNYRCIENSMYINHLIGSSLAKVHDEKHFIIENQKYT